MAIDKGAVVYGGGAFLLAGIIYYLFLKNDVGGNEKKLEAAAGNKPQPPTKLSFSDIDYTINKWIDNNPSYRANLNVIYTAYSMGEITLDDAVMRTRQLINIYKDNYAGYIMRKGSI